MQTFLPYPDFYKSAKTLDKARLRKQAIEARGILDTITGKSESWKNHPAVNMWRGYDRALAIYGVIMASEAGYINIGKYLQDYLNLNSDLPYPNPPWMGLDAFHASHRSKLLYKGRLDAVCYSIRAALKERSINDWLNKNNYPAKNLLNRNQVAELEHYAWENNIKISPNWYEQFNWSEPDTYPYYWPTKQMSLTPT